MNIRKLAKQTRCDNTPGTNQKHRLLAGRLFLGIGILLAMSLSVVGAQPSGLRIMASSNETTSISQYGITWYFDSAVEYGQFVNGDYWVVGPVTVIDIDPLSSVDGGRTRHGSMINPHRGQTQGYDSHPKSGGYSSTLNVGRPGGNALSADNPLVLKAGQSLVSTRSGEPAGRWPPGQLNDAAVLTVVDSAVPEGTFRPPYTNGSKEYRWHVDDIDWDKLKARQVPTSSLSTLPNLSSIEARVERVWLDHSEAWQFCHVVPTNNMPSFGREFQKRVGDAALTLLLDYRQEDLEPIMYGFLQIGIDLFGLAEQGQTWWANGAIFGGRKLPILFSGWLFENEVASDMLGIADGGQNFIFHEDQQVRYVDEHVVEQGIGYTDAWMGLPEWGIRFHQWYVNGNTHEPDASWGARYRNNNIGSAGIALAVIIARISDKWNHPAFFDYHDRAYAARPEANGDDPAGAFFDWKVQTNGLTRLAFDMWEQFRVFEDDYRPVWSAPF